MALRVSTTGLDVTIDDLGITLVHPTNNEDLTDQFSAEEIKESEDLTAAIQGGDLIADDGTFVIAGADYDPAEVVNQELGLKLDDRFISHDELAAGYLDTEIVAGEFPLALNSTASSTRNVYTPGGKWGTWSLSPDDKVVISGTTGGADGVYTVESVTDAQNFIVVEAIPNSTGGTVTAYHPVAASRIGVDDSGFATASGSDLQALLADIDANLGGGGGGVTPYVADGESASQSSTTSGSLQQKLRVTTPSLTNGVNYGIFWYAELGATGDADAYMTVQLNDSVTLAECEFKNYPYATRREPQSGFYVSDSLSGVQNIDIDYAMTYGGTAYIRRARILVMRLD